jgi:hypothetical protein
LNFDIYLGKHESCREKISEKAVKKMIEDFSEQNYVIHMDSFFSSPTICRYLDSKGFSVIGMVNNNRKGLSTEFKNKILEKGETSFYENKEQFFVAWKDKRQISLLSNIKDNDIVNSRTYNNKKN